MAATTFNEAAGVLKAADIGPDGTLTPVVKLSGPVTLEDVLVALLTISRKLDILISLQPNGGDTSDLTLI
jgi:hypothetical protein